MIRLLTSLKNPRTQINEIMGFLMQYVWFWLLVCVIQTFRCEWFRGFESDLVTVDTQSGKIIGRKAANLNIFLGIPYAEPPLGQYRFRPPRPKSSWHPAAYRALTYGPECLQSSLYAESDDNRDITMSEDCLYLNIWQPARDHTKSSNARNSELLPVMVWIYGGAFLHGSANRAEYEGSKLARKGTGTIVVSFNYRLGALGFLVSTADGLYGNYGLEDQKMALQWVKDNIRSFGGDPERITLFGESAGAMSIGLHLLDQEASFQPPVYQSSTGTGTSEESSAEDDTRNAIPAVSPRDKLFRAVILQSNPLGYK